MLAILWGSNLHPPGGSEAVQDPEAEISVALYKQLV